MSTFRPNGATPVVTVASPSQATSVPNVTNSNFATTAPHPNDIGKTLGTVHYFEFLNVLLKFELFNYFQMYPVDQSSNNFSPSPSTPVSTPPPITPVVPAWIPINHTSHSPHYTQPVIAATNANTTQNVHLVIRSLIFFFFLKTVLHDLFCLLIAIVCLN